MDPAVTPDVVVPADAMSPEAATARRAELMANPDFRRAAAAGGEAWQELQRLDGFIAAGIEDESQMPLPDPAAHLSAEAGDDGVPPGFFDPPASPSGYSLPTQQARQAGIAIDANAEMAMRQAFHAAGVDNALATVLYTAWMGSALSPRTPVDDAGEHFRSEQLLRSRWGAEFDANLAAANDYARSVFERMPVEFTGGLPFRDFCVAYGIANNHAVVEQLLLRARHAKT